MRRWSVVVSTLLAAVRRGVPRFPTMFEGGNVLVRAGRYEEAVRLYREAAGDPSFGRRRPAARARLHYNTGYALAKLGRFFAAARAYRRCLEITPNDVDAWFNLGQVYREAGALKRAQQAFGRAAALDPTEHEVWNNLGNVCAALEDVAGAEAAYRSALALKPDYYPAWNNLGNILQSLDRHTDAISCYDRAINLQGGGEMISYFNRALSLVSLGRSQEALRDLNRWAILPPWQGTEAHGPDWLRLLQSLSPPRLRQSAR
jgi:tetratricopeptide (TPR) repeat protein